MMIAQYENITGNGKGISSATQGNPNLFLSGFGLAFGTKKLRIPKPIARFSGHFEA